MQNQVPQNVSERVESPQSGVGVKNLWEWLQDWVHRLGKKPKIGLALGSGAAWGVAHVGVLSVFRELNVSISYLSGSSAGSFVGAMYAGGVEGGALEACGRDYSWRDAGRLNYIPRMGLATNERMVSYLQKRIGNPRFGELRVPFYVAATALTTGQLKFFNEGPVIPAVRASCAIPGIFAPIQIDGELYCDGGLLNKVPCEILREAGADVVIGVELCTYTKQAPPANIFEVITRAFDIALFRQTSSDNQVADLIIRPKVDGLYEFGFDQNGVLIERGKQAASNQLKQGRQLHAPVTMGRTEQIT